VWACANHIFTDWYRWCKLARGMWMPHDNSRKFHVICCRLVSESHYFCWRFRGWSNFFSQQIWNCRLQWCWIISVIAILPPAALHFTGNVGLRTVIEMPFVMFVTTEFLVYFCQHTNRYAYQYHNMFTVWNLGHLLVAQKWNFYVCISGLWSWSQKEFWVESESVKVYWVRVSKNVLALTLTSV
jgi:hypothetical protein